MAGNYVLKKGVGFKLDALCMEVIHTVPPKIQHFLWRLLNVLAVGDLLAVRDIHSELQCKSCGENPLLQ